MFESKALFGILSSLFVFIGGIPYLRDIHNRKVSPQVLSWVGWGFISTLGAIVILSVESTWVVAILFANALLCFVIAGYAVIRKVGAMSTGMYDYILFGFGILGLIFWLILDLPVVALFCSILADFSFGLPTIIKTYKDPSSETPFVWVSAVISGILSLFAVQHYVFYELLYPVYLLSYDLFVLLIILGVIHSSKYIKRKKITLNR